MLRGSGYRRCGSVSWRRSVSRRSFLRVGARAVRNAASCSASQLEDASRGYMSPHSPAAWFKWHGSRAFRGRPASVILQRVEGPSHAPLSRLHAAALRWRCLLSIFPVRVAKAFESYVVNLSLQLPSTRSEVSPHFSRRCNVSAERHPCRGGFDHRQRDRAAQIKEKHLQIMFEDDPGVLNGGRRFVDMRRGS